jgi:uncharacterized DUF497 family protein
MARFRFLAWLVDWLLLQPSFQFDWDDGNQTKSADKHGVSCAEAEEVFAARESAVALGEQVSPAAREPRYGILGVTRAGRRLFVCFTLRGTGVRVISARDMNRKEMVLYEKVREE